MTGKSLIERMQLVCAALLLMLAGCQQSPPAADELRIGLAQPPMTLDPRYATDAASHRVQELIHRGLIRLDAHFRPVPDAALSWTHPDARTFRFRLRKNLHFHDGRPVTAHDVAATLRAILNPRQASPLRAGFSAIERIETPDDATLVLHLSHPDASFLTRLTVGILPARIAAGPQQARRIVGCGPCRLVSWDEKGLLLARVKPDASGLFNRFRFITVRDPVTRVLKLARHELDFTENDLPPHLLPFLRRQPQLHIVTRPSTTFAYIGFNLRDPVLSDVRVRRALALAVDRARLKRALFSDLPRLAETVLVPDHWAAANLPATPFDPARARRLLDAAGYRPGPDGVRFRLNYRTSTDPARLRMAVAIADMWRRIGVETKVESLEWGGFYARIKRGDFQVYSLSWVGIVDPDIYRWILHSSMWPPKGANRGRYANPRVDGWLDAAMQTEDMNRRKELYARVERQMQADQVYIPLWHEPVIAVLGPRVTGFTPAPDGSLGGLLRARRAKPSVGR
jgi:peptide/nickel transport system substrate-binding protein